jgi:head-tail adaptor
MSSRAFNKRVEIWQTSVVADSYGGNTVSDELIKTSWANLKTLKSNSNLITDLGLLDASNSIVITVRKRNDLTYDLQTMYIKYRNEKYIIKSYPANVNFEDNIIQFICTKESNNA